MIPISTVTVGSGGASAISFTEIPQIYTDLKILISARGSRSNSGSQTVSLRFNSDSGANYSYRRLYGDGSTLASDSGTGDAYGTAGYVAKAYDTANTFGNCEIYIPNYIGSSQKSYSSEGVEENNATLSYSSLVAGLWTGTAPINTILLYASAGSFTWEQHSTATLYGIRKY